MTTLVTGAAGFIGFHLCSRLIQSGETVIGFDSINSYYDVNLKRARIKFLNELASEANITFVLIEGHLEDFSLLENIFKEYIPDNVVNLAAQAGVRYSLENPGAYIQSNIVGFANVLECCRHHQVQHLVYASSSSVYGGNTNLPFSEQQAVDHPVSLYAASKKSNELMAHSYSHLYGLPTTGLRFFTVYGPWGRPDMALFLFTKAILEGQPIKIFNNGQMMRDFTYVDDIIESVVRLLDKPPSSDDSFCTDSPNPGTSWAPYKIFNIGNSSPVPLLDYVNALEHSIGVSATKVYLPIQPGDVPATSADTSALETWIGFKPKTPIADGISRFVSWYRDYYGI